MWKPDSMMFWTFIKTEKRKKKKKQTAKMMKFDMFFYHLKPLETDSNIKPANISKIIAS